MRRRIPVAIVHDLAEHELIPRRIRRLVINLLMIEESPVLILGQAIRDDV